MHEHEMLPTLQGIEKRYIEHVLEKPAATNDGPRLCWG